MENLLLVDKSECNCLNEPVFYQLEKQSTQSLFQNIAIKLKNFIELIDAIVLCNAVTMIIIKRHYS